MHCADRSDKDFAGVKDMDQQDELIKATTAVRDALSRMGMTNETKMLALVANVAYMLRTNHDWLPQRQLEAKRLADCLVREAMRDDRSVA